MISGHPTRYRVSAKGKLEYAFLRDLERVRSDSELRELDEKLGAMTNRHFAYDKILTFFDVDPEAPDFVTYATFSSVQIELLHHRDDLAERLPSEQEGDDKDATSLGIAITDLALRHFDEFFKCLCVSGLLEAVPFCAKHESTIGDRSMALILASVEKRRQNK